MIRKDDPRQGLFVCETRMLSKYRWRLNKKEPILSAASAIEQHRWLGYYVALPPDLTGAGSAETDPLQQSRCTHRHGVTWSTEMPRSWSNSSTSRYDKEKRRYHPTARRITPGSNWRHLNRPAIEGTSDIPPA
jgi:hypothetical protein